MLSKIIGAVVLLLVVVAGYWSWVHRDATVEAPVTEQHILQGEQIGEGDLYTYNKEEANYTVKVEYPETHNQQAQLMLETVLKQEIDDFVENVAGLDATVLPSLADGHKLALDVTYKSYSGAYNTKSYLFTVFADTGGAHPNTYFKTFVFDENGKALTIQDMVKTSDLSKLASVVTKEVTAQMKERLGQSDVTSAIFKEGLTPTENNYSNYLIDGNDLLIEIPPYQVAAYVMGSFEVRVPLSSVQ